MDKEDLEALVELTVHRTVPIAVAETLLRFGLDASSPIETQKDFAFLREHRVTVEGDDYKSDMAHLRSWRNLWDTVKSNGVVITVSAVIASGLAYLGLRQ